MKVVSLEDGYEQDFWNHINRDPLDYYFLIFDMKQRHEKTRTLAFIHFL